MAGSILALSALNMQSPTDQVKANLRTIPGVDALLQDPAIKDLNTKYRYSVVLGIIKRKIEAVRKRILNGETFSGGLKGFVDEVCRELKSHENPKLKRVINATGIILHTNLGRSPLGKGLLPEVERVVGGYTNLEFDLAVGKRGKRKEFFAPLVRALLNVEDVAVVNNNAAAVFLCLKAIAENKEVIVSRGELIEIGDSFRIPDIMQLSGVKVVEVGSTNKTKIQDYENAINSETAVLFKTHRSNFTMAGFTQEVSAEEIVKLGSRDGLVTMCDIGSGLLFKDNSEILKQELSIEETLEAGFDLVMFSGDKLMGGPQCGIIVGKKNLISKIEKHPLMRTYRLDKLTITVLVGILKEYLRKVPDKSINPVYRHLSEHNVPEVRQKAEKLFALLCSSGISAEIVDSKVQCGGGTLPEVYMNSVAVEVIPQGREPGELYLRLLQLETPVVTFLKQGNLVIDLFCLDEDDITYVAEKIAALCQSK